MKADRMYHSIRLLLCRKPSKRAAYLKKHDLLGAIGDNCKWGPWLLPLYPKLIKLGNNVHVHKTSKIVTHDMLNNYLMKCYPGEDFGHKETIGCVELMDNVYVAMNCTVMPNVRINKNCIITAGSVVTSDIPENSVASGVPAKPTGRFDMFVALRKMSRGQRVKVKNQELDDALAVQEWERFTKRRDK